MVLAHLHGRRDLFMVGAKAAFCVPHSHQIHTWWGRQAGHRRGQARSSWGTRCQMRIRALEVRLDRVKQVLCQPTVQMQCQQFMGFTFTTAS